MIDVRKNDVLLYLVTAKSLPLLGICTWCDQRRRCCSCKPGRLLSPPESLRWSSWSFYVCENLKALFVFILTPYPQDGHRILFYTSQRERFCIIETVRNGSGARPGVRSLGTCRTVFWREAEQSILPSFEVKNVWSCSSVFHTLLCRPPEYEGRSRSKVS